MKQNAHNASGHYCTTVQSQKCELSFHQGVWTLIPSNILQTLHHNVWCIHNTYSRGNSLLYSPTRKEKRKTVTQPPHLHTTPPCPHPSSNPTAACPPTCATHPCHLRSSADTSSLPLWSLLFMKGKRREKEKFFFLSLSLAAAAWLLCCWKRQLLRQWPEDGQFPPPHPYSKPIFYLSSAFVPNPTVTC